MTIVRMMLMLIVNTKIMMMMMTMTMMMMMVMMMMIVQTNTKMRMTMVIMMIMLIIIIMILMRLRMVMMIRMIRIMLMPPVGPNQPHQCYNRSALLTCLAELGILESEAHWFRPINLPLLFVAGHLLLFHDLICACSDLKWRAGSNWTWGDPSWQHFFTFPSRNCAQPDLTQIVLWFASSRVNRTFIYWHQGGPPFFIAPQAVPWSEP